MAEQPVVEKMSQLQVDPGKTVMFEFFCMCPPILSRCVQLAAS